jgi:hypothetical protein
VVTNWRVGETIPIGRDRTLRVVGIVVSNEDEPSVLIVEIRPRLVDRLQVCPLQVLDQHRLDPLDLAERTDDHRHLLQPPRAEIEENDDDEDV